MLKSLRNKIPIFTLRGAGSKKYLLEGTWGDNYVADLEAKTFSCKKRDLCGVPCVHAVSAIACCDEDFEAYVDECYYIDTYAKVYELVVLPISLT